MSTRVVTTCDGCGAERQGTDMMKWRRWDTETFFLTGVKDKVANVHVCPACVTKLAKVTPDLHKAV